jgi:hypothetical protein
MNAKINATLGSELITAPMVTGGWTLGYDAGVGGWSITGGVLSKTASTNTVAATAVSGMTSAPTIGVIYKVVIVVSATSGTIYYSLGGTRGRDLTSVGTYVDYLYAATTAKLIISGVASGTATITSVSVAAITAATGDMLVEGNIKAVRIQSTSGIDAIRFYQNGSVAFPYAVGISGTLSAQSILSDNYTDASFSYYMLVNSGGNATLQGKANFNCTVKATGTGLLLLNPAGNFVGINTSTPTKDLGFGGNVARTIWMERHTTANNPGNSFTLQAGGATAGATDKDGGMEILAPGVSTGTGKASVRVQSLGRAASTGTADNTLEDRLIITSVANLTNNAVVGLFEVALPAGSSAGGKVDYTISASDGTDFHSISGCLYYDVTNKAGVYVSQITSVLNTLATSDLTGTNVPAWSIVTGTNKFTVSVSDADSLTTTSLKIRYTITNGSGSAITQL